MSKKFIISTCILFLAIFCTFSFSLSNDATNMLEDATNGVRNAVGGAENMIENAAGGVSNTAKNVTGDMENGARGMTNSVSNTMSSSTRNSDNNGYTATRTATDTSPATFMGMTANTWTWLIMGIATIAIVALVWYYSNQLRTSKYDDSDRF